MAVQYLVYPPIIIGIFLLGLVTLLQNPKKILNISFAIFSLNIIIWELASFLADTSSSNQSALLFVTSAIAIASFFPLTYTIFCYEFPYRDPKQDRRGIYLVGIFALISFLLTVGGVSVQSVTSESFGAKINESSIVYTAQVLFFLIGAIYGTYLLFRKRRRTSGQTRAQIQIVIYALGSVALINVLVNGFFVSEGSSSLGPLVGSTSVMLITIAMSYAIIKHKMFDIRLIVARSVGYIFSVGTLAILYGLIAFTVINRFIFNENTSVGFQQFVYTLLAVILAFTFQPMRKYFDRLTNKLFYRDAYDSQVLLDELNKILVGNIDIQPLLRQCAELFETTLKAEYCTFIIRGSDDTVRRIIGSKKIDLEEDQILELSSQYHKTDQIVVADELEESQTTLKAMLSKNNVSILARLAPDGKNTVEQGYLVLGNKRSGNPYNKQDLQVLDIIANELVIAIQNALRFEEIEAFTVTLQEKVDEATRQLRSTNEKLKALDETKDEFISMASHQLRTPLTAVKGYVSMVVEGDAGKLNKQQKELLDQSFSSSQRMVYLIADLLNVSRLKTGKFVIENKQTNLAEVVEAEIEQLKQAAAGKKQTLTYNRPAKFPEMNLDETKIRQVIMNFIDNALHYTQKGGHITVNLKDTDKSIEFIVEDNGLGVPKAEQKHLFTKFFRAQNAKKARPDGTGLGLFMAKKVIIAQGGAVLFTSTEGKGSNFGFTIPKHKPTQQKQ